LPGRSFAECVPLFGDCYRQAVTWKSGSGLPTDQGVVLRFLMDQVRLYALDFAA